MDFNYKKPYKVVELKKDELIRYIIIQPIMFFGLKLYWKNITEQFSYHGLKHTKQFIDKKSVDDFILSETKKNNPIIQTVVFDSEKDKINLKTL